MKTKTKTIKPKLSDYICVSKRSETIIKVYNGAWIESEPGKFSVKGQYSRLIESGKTSKRAYMKTGGKYTFRSRDYYIIKMK